jgi:hypothetical protein
MRTFIIALICLVVGAAVGAFGAFGLGAGLGAGAGILVGAQAGACLALEAAKDRGLLEPSDVDALIADAASRIRSEAPADTPSDFHLVRSEADCAEMVAKLKTGG